MAIQCDTGCFVATFVDIMAYGNVVGERVHHNMARVSAGAGA